MSFFEALMPFAPSKKQIQKPAIDLVLSAEGLEAQLQDIATKSLQWGTDVVVDADQQTLTLPQVFFRYAEDFGFSSDEKVRKAMKLLTGRDRRKLAKFTRGRSGLRLLCAGQG